MSDQRGGSLLKKRSFWVRTLSGIVICIILVTVFILGYNVMWGFVLALSLLGQFEFYRALNLGWCMFSIVGYAATVAYYVVLLFAGICPAMVLVLAIMVIVDLAVFVFTYPNYSLQKVFGSVFGTLYIGVSLSFLYLLRIYPPYGAYIVWLVVISAWGCDIFAYLTGMLFGKTKFIPKLSPNKSLEGCIGGIIGAMVLAVIYAFAVGRWITGIRLPWLIFPFVCMLGAAAGQIGDLAASAVKRMTGIKDYGKLIPGHGGILDRFDSMIMVAPIIYIITIWFRIRL